MLHRRLVILMLLTLVCQPLASVAQAQTLQFDAGFDPNHVLEDSDIFDVKGMTYDRMVDFMRSKGNLADLLQKDTDGVMKPASQIIWRVANTYKINPKYILALIQKEQSLVEGPTPSQKQLDWATGYGVCDNCSMDDPSIQDFKGFASQVEWSAKQFREKYLQQILGNGQTRGGNAPGKTIAIDGLSVTPTNKATAMLYSYTPHIHGNLNLWRIWRRWFALSFPDGTVARGITSGKTYLIRLGQKRAFASPDVMLSLVDPNKVVLVSDTELDAYPNGPKILFPKYALLRDSKKHIWLLTDTSRRLIVDVKAFHAFGFNQDEVIDVDSDDELAEYPIGENITATTQFPTGVVMQNKTDKTLWYVEGDTRMLLPDKVFVTLYFAGRNIKQMTPKQLSVYKIGNLYSFHDGELVRGTKDPSVYVVVNGNLDPIANGAVFQALGWQWKNVVTVPDKVITEYTIGQQVVGAALAPATPDTSL